MTQEVKLKRVSCNYEADNTRFLLECDFSKQYSHYYLKRLEKTKPFLEFNCRSKWSPNIPLYGLAELAAISNSYQASESLLDTNISTPTSSTSSQTTPGDCKPLGSYKYSKRLRKYSEGSRNNSPFKFKSSTQEHNNTVESPVPPIESPILKTEQQNQNQGSQKDTDPEGGAQQCIIIGTIFKRMKLQPDVVRELSKGDFHVKCDRYLGHYTSQDDRLVLEDADESISLVGNIEPKRFVTGIVVALLGYPVEDGSQFYVQGICYAEPNKQILYEDEDSISISHSIIERPFKGLLEQQPIYLMVISGLGFHQEMGKKSALTRALQNMIYFIWGGDKYSDDDRSSRVARILVAGDSLHEGRLHPTDDNASSSSQHADLAIKMKQSRQVKQYSESIQAVHHMDDFFAQLSKTVEVDVMPGASDPSSHLLPQQPFHPCMFPKSCMFASFNCITNPHRAIYNQNVEILATSGQNVDIIGKFSGLRDPIEIMKCHLMWGNSAPSAPDNLYSVPYEDEDPYVMDFIPEVYIAGCQNSYRTSYYSYTSRESRTTSSTNYKQEASVQVDRTRDLVNVSGQKESIPSSSCTNIETTAPNNDTPPFIPGRKNHTLLITVPRFNETFSCVLINLINLESHLLNFE